MDSEELLTEEGYAMNVGRLNENRKKNRYNDIVPCKQLLCWSPSKIDQVEKFENLVDYSRVMLSDSPDFYINSSYINVIGFFTGPLFTSEKLCCFSSGS